jgi:MscS family membrane protein
MGVGTKTTGGDPMEFLDKVFWGNPVKSYLIAAGIVVGALIVASIVGRLLKAWVIKRAAKTGTRLDDLLAEVGSRPIYWVIVLAGLHAGVNTLVTPDWFSKMAWTVLVVAWTAVGAVFLSRLLNGLALHYLRRYAVEKDDALFRQLVRMFRSAIGVVIWVVAGLFIVSNLGFNVSSLLAGLGLGGLAVAMAAKDTLSNVFGSFTILVNGPFMVGEMIKYQGQEGTVEEIGMRDTRIRLWNGNLVSVPNSLATTSVIENISRRPSFRVLFNLGLVYETAADQLDRLAELVKQAVRAEEGTSDDIRVHFLEFGESALNVQVIYFIEDSSRILDARHGVNKRIKDLCHQAGIDMAFRTVTVKQG